MMTRGSRLDILIISPYNTRSAKMEEEFVETTQISMDNEVVVFPSEHCHGANDLDTSGKSGHGFPDVDVQARKDTSGDMNVIWGIGCPIVEENPPNDPTSPPHVSSQHPPDFN
jgi:hypothetical protein